MSIAKYIRDTIIRNGGKLMKIDRLFTLIKNNGLLWLISKIKIKFLVNFESLFSWIFVKNRYKDINAMIQSDMLSEIYTFISSSMIQEYKLSVDESSAFSDVKREYDELMKKGCRVLGFGRYKYGDSVSWSEDPIHSYRWEKRFYKKIKLVNSSIKADVKIPWEASRFNYITILGKMFLITNDKHIYNSFKNIIISWIDENPIEYSVNWTCSMEVAIRACNWMVGMSFFSENIEYDKDFFRLINASLVAHARYIKNNLEYESSNNHLLTNFTGLLLLGIYFKKSSKRNSGLYKESSRWIQFATDELYKYSRLFVTDMGVLYEDSTYYHAYVFEMFLYSYILIENSNEIATDKLWNEWIKMYDFFSLTIDKFGYSYGIGDKDDGRFVCLTNDSYKGSFKSTKKIAYNIIFEKISPKKINLISESKNLVDCKDYTTGVRVWKDEGFHLYGAKEYSLLVRTSPSNSLKKGVHRHNDQLSFNLVINDNPVIIETGTGSYTGDDEIRNKYRSTSMHNTLVCCDLEQNAINQDLFSHVLKNHSKCISCHDNYFKFIFENPGYKHIRSILFNEKSIEINDKVISSSENNSILFLHLHPSVKVMQNISKLILLCDNTRIELYSSANQIIIEEYDYYPYYGFPERSNRIRFVFKEEHTMEMRWENAK